MAQAQQRYASCRRTALAAWLTAVVAPALLGWGFWAATGTAPATIPATVAPPPSQHVVVTQQPVDFRHR